MIKSLKIIDAPLEDGRLYLFDDLPGMAVSSVGLAERVTAAWRPLIDGRGVAEAVTGVFTKYCKVRQLQPPQLSVRKGLLEGVETTVGVSPFGIGRKAENQLVLTEVGVSGFHAQLVQDEDRWTIQDLGSVNGTMINGKRLEKSTPQTLKNGDMIAVMGTDIHFKQPEPLMRPPEVELFFRDLTAGLPAADTANLTGAVFGLHGSDQRLTLLMETDFVRLWLESLIGIHYVGSELAGALSDVEKGLFEFLLLKFVQSFQTVICPEKTGLLFLAAVESPLPDLEPREAAVVRFTFRFENRTGDIALLLPDSCENGWPERLAAPREGAGQGQVERIRRLVAPWGWLSVPVMVMVGAIDLSPAELVSLEPGDAILLPPGPLSLGPADSLNGLASLLFSGAGQVRGRAELAVEDQRYRVIFREFFKHQTEAPMEQQALDTQANQAQGPPVDPEVGGELLRELTLTLVVELDRFHLTMADLIQLSPGQVFQLQRAPTDPVSLSVDGRIVGRGQLVKINNELGVKIVSLLKK